VIFCNVALGVFLSLLFSNYYGNCYDFNCCCFCSLLPVDLYTELRGAEGDVSLGSI